MDNGFNIIMVIAIILFARLAVRLIIGYQKAKKSENNNNQKE